VSVALPLALVFVLCIAGALAGLVVPQRRNPAVTAVFGAASALSAAWACALALPAGEAFHSTLWNIEGVPLTLSFDRLSAAFLLPASIVMLAASVYSASYLDRYAGRYSLRALNAWFLLLFASIVAILVSDNVLLFLLAWEAMSLTSYLLVAFENRREESSEAAFMMLGMGEAGFAAVAVVLVFLAVRGGTFELGGLPAACRDLGEGKHWALFLLVFFGFGVKAGLVPFNSWLPRAHPAAPANVSAMLSGAILNLGLYGITRIAIGIAPPAGAGPGLVVLVVGSLSALVGILYATAENDLKALLAHSSIENIGVVGAGLGAGMIFAHYQHPALASIGFIAAFYHMLNHSMYKGLLFLGAGVVDDRAGTRDLNCLGGLVRGMPWTSALVLVGTLSISALPPFNGFTSEWLTLQVLLRAAELDSTGTKLVFVLCGATLALSAALAVTCFVKMFAMGFLGMARSRGAGAARDPRPSSLAPMLLLAAICLALGVLPTYVIGGLDAVLQPLAGQGVDALVPPFFAGAPTHADLPRAFLSEFHDLGAQAGENVLPGRGLVVLHRGGTDNPVVFAMSMSYAAVVLAALLLASVAVVRLGLARLRVVRRGERWAGGLRRLLPEMTYTATGFSNPVRVIFDAIFRPRTVEDTRDTVAEHFRNAIRREDERVHLVDRAVSLPVRRVSMALAGRLARMHHGRVNAYAAYVLVALLLALIVGLI